MDGKQQLYGYGEQMRQALLTGIEGSYSAREEFLGIIAGNRDPVELATEDSTWGDIMRTLNDGYTDAKARAKELCQQLTDALNSAFEDGILSGDELHEIAEILNSMDEEMAARVSSDEKEK